MSKKDLSEIDESIPMICHNDIFPHIKSCGRLLQNETLSNSGTFLRISSKINLIELKTLLIGSFERKCPSLIFSLIGNPKEPRTKSRLFQIFRQGLLKISERTEIWIITTHLNNHLRLIIEEILRTNSNPLRSIHLITIDLFSAVKINEEVLLHDESKTNLLTIVSNEKLSLLIDDLHAEQLDDFRSNFETILHRESSMNTNDSMFNQREIPLILFLVDGEFHLIPSICQRVLNDRLPLILFEGTGGSADLLAKSLTIYLQFQSNLSKFSSFDEKLQTIVNHDRNLSHCISQCLHERVNFWNILRLKVPHIQRDFDFIILQSLLNVKSNDDRLEQFHLALEWNRVDILQNLLIKDDPQWKKIHWNEFFLRALHRNQVEFVQLFLDHHFPLRQLFGDPHRIFDLYLDENYSDVSYDDGHPLKSIWKQIFHALIGSSDYHRYEDERKALIDIDKELFLWSIITNKQEMALLFWSRTKNKIAGALFAALIYRIKLKRDKDQRYLPWSNQFENLALEIFEKFYLKDINHCRKCLLIEIPSYAHLTTLHIAVLADAKAFLTHKAIHDVLTRIWFGSIDNQNGNERIILASFLPIFSGFLRYHDDPFDDQIDHCPFQENQTRNRNESSVHHDEFNSMKTRCNRRKYLQNVGQFLDVPYVKYLYNLYSHLLFLLLFSYVILCDFYPLYHFERDKCLIGTEENHYRESKNVSESANHGSNPRPHPSGTELILTFWIFTLFCEEIRQIGSMERLSIKGKLIEYFTIFWNQLDLIAIIIYFVGIVLRSIESSECFCAARILLAVDLSLWYLRTLDIFSAMKKLGPKLVMIGQMIYDLKFFILILTVFLCAFGIPAYSLIYGVEEFSWHLPRIIINTAYWQMFGELEILDEIEKNYDASGYVVFILLIVYMTMSSVLLINLLIAMFSNTLDRLENDRDSIWRCQYYSLVCYYLTRPLLPPPLVVFPHLYHLFIYLGSECFCLKSCQTKYQRFQQKSKFRILVDQRLKEHIEIVEDALGNEVYYYLKKFHRKQANEKFDFNEQRMYSSQEMINNQIKLMKDQILSMQNQQDQIFEQVQSLNNRLDEILIFFNQK